jgi:BirA family transcriptional regulator, biotin operon repressor / biotin---[acetyl-CoA-carboxylase] ligase
MIAVTGRAPSLPPAYRLVALDRVGSTMDEARRLAADGAEDGTLVWAREQTGGRGRLGRAWESPPGNLYCTLVLRPDIPLSRAPELGFVAALGVGGMVGAMAPPMTEIRYKWPNDVLLNDAKCSGILLESSTRPDGALDFLVLGVGVNLASHPRDTAFPATSLRAEGAEVTEVEAGLESFARHLLHWIDRWLDEGFPAVRKAWLDRAWRLNERLDVKLGDGDVSGSFAGLADDGALILALADGTRRVIAAGDVRAARAG